MIINDLSVKAQQHHELMKSKFADKIKFSVDNSKIYDRHNLVKQDYTNSISNKIIVEDLDSVSALTKYMIGNTAVLNFASYLFPGGGFLGGSRAQEEALCHESILYEVLTDKKFEDFYNYNHDHMDETDHFYDNRLIYSKYVLFETSDNQQYFTDVITVAAPNKNGAFNGESFDERKNSRILRSRIEFLLDVAKSENVETLILGAFGCGVFSQDPLEVAETFKDVLKEKPFKNVIFAVQKLKNLTNYLIFKEVFG